MTARFVAKDLPARSSVEETLIWLIGDVRSNLASTRSQIVELATIVLHSNFSKNNLDALKKAFDDMLIRVEFSKTGRYSERIIRLVKNAKRSLDEQARAFEAGAESSEDGNGADHRHVHVDESGDGSSSASPTEPQASAEEEAHRRAE